MNKTSENTIYIIDNKNIVCQHKQLYPLTEIKIKWISETIYGDIVKIFQNDSQK